MKKDNWIILDAKEKILGRLASRIAFLLMGKDRTDYCSNKVVGNQIIVINSKSIKVTGKKFLNKFYYKHSEYPSGMKTINFQQLLFKNSNLIIRNAVKGMLPKNKLQKIFLKRLKIYEYDIHPHLAQKPFLLEL